MAQNTVGLCIIYRWRLKPGLEKQFIENWSAATKLLMDVRGALGSRLHQCEDGTWMAYAQWPSKATWEHHRSLPSVDAEVLRRMLEAEEEAFPPILLRPVADYLGSKPLLYLTIIYKACFLLLITNDT
ncbi:MAG: antibiotic biosynthesis monooxygenase family protein [Chitinophagaceae bacterium]